MVTPNLKARLELNAGMREWAKQFGKAHLIASVFVGDLELASSDHGQSSKRRALESGEGGGGIARGSNDLGCSVHNGNNGQVDGYPTAKVRSTNSHTITTRIEPSESGPVDNGN
jgi:hypothetical protein